MAERRRERRREQGEPAPRRQETRQDKETRFIIAAKDLAAQPEEIEQIKSALLKNAVSTLKNFRTAEGAVVQPEISAAFFSLSFSLSFSLGFGRPEELVGGPTR